MGIGNYAPDSPDMPAIHDFDDFAPPAKFPDYLGLYDHAIGWVQSHTKGSSKGAVAHIWINEGLIVPDCPARVSFERAIAAVNSKRLTSWDVGEFGWHGTKSMDAIQGISWNSWDTKRRSGQACGPGEYFSRGTDAGLTYSQGYAGGGAGHVLIVAWIMPHDVGAAPTNPGANGSGSAGSTGHIVCRNPVGSNGDSTGVMYCLPVLVVAFGASMPAPNVRQFHKSLRAASTLAVLSSFAQYPDATKLKLLQPLLHPECSNWPTMKSHISSAMTDSNLPLLKSRLADAARCKEADQIFLKSAHQFLTYACEGQLKSCMAGDDVTALQQTISLTEGVKGINNKLLELVKRKLRVLTINAQRLQRPPWLGH